MNKIYIVEGKRDKETLKRINPELFVLTTNGYNFDDKFINQLIELEKTNQIVLILDPDFPGQKIRDKISASLSNPIHIYIPKKDAVDIKKHKVGLEHVDLDKLEEIIKNEISYTKVTNKELFAADFIKLNLTGSNNSQERRNIVTNHFHLPKSNAKRLLEYLNKLAITKEQLKEVLNES